MEKNSRMRTLPSDRSDRMERSLHLFDDQKNNTNFNKIAALEQKLKMYGGLQEMEQQFLFELNNHNKRLDGIIATLKQVVKADVKGRRNTGPGANYKHTSKPSDRSNNKLIERVEKAIHKQNLNK